MDWRDTPQLLRSVVDFKLFEISGTPITLATLITIGVIVLLSLYLSKLLEKGFRKALRGRGLEETGTTVLLGQVLRYALLATGLAVALGTAGVDLAAIFATGAVFAVVAGFAMQNIAENFMSGLILLAERTLKPGDIIEIDGVVVKVTRLGIRATVVRSRDDEDLIVPNSLLVKATVKNYTLKDSVYRLRAQVGVVYGSDMKIVRSTLERVTGEIPWRLREFEPRIILTEFGNHSVNWDVSVWIADPWRALRLRSALNEAIWWSLKEQGIIIAFPQLDVHFDAPVVESLRGLGPRAA